MEIETQIVKNQHVGYSFSVSVEKETREESGTKYPDKTVVSARISGNEETFEAVTKRLDEAKTKIGEVLGK